MRVLFVNCVDFLQVAIPEGIALMSAVLKERGHETGVFDTAFLRQKTENERTIGVSFHKKTPYTPDDMIPKGNVDINDKFSDMLNKFNPSLVAVSTMTTNYEKSLNLLKKVKPKCKVIMGGVHPTLMPDVIKEDDVDFVCIGEGDEALLELCEVLENGKDPSGIRNLSVKTKDGIIKNRLRPFMDLDRLPTPDLSIFDTKHFFRPFLGKVYRGMFLSTSRGCPRGCAYCVNNRLRTLFRECGKRYLRFQSPRIIAKNIKSLKKEYGIEWFKFSDDTFLSRPLDSMRELRDLLKPLNIMFGCSIDPATVTKEKVELAKDMGCVSMTVGIETGNENIRKNILKRHITNKQIEKAINTIKDYDIKLSTFNMIGLPLETTENIYETIRLNKKLWIKDANVYVFYPFFGTKIYDDLMSNVYSGMPKMKKEEIVFFLKTFNLFLSSPEKDWGKIKNENKEKEN